jgi:UDP-N-acetyl-2-amino-2-deoxyglucuronate dehydrogenase
MNEKINTGLVGCGKVGQTHAQALSSLPESNFTAVCDANPERASAFADKFHVTGFTSVAEMIASQKVQAIVVSTPHPLHAEPAIQAAKAGIHVLVEKPMAASLKDCDAMLAAAQEGKVKLGIVSQRRLYAPVQRVKTAIEAGKIGRPVLGMVMMLGWRDEKYFRSDPWRGTWKGEGGGVLVNQSPHQLDLLQWFMGPISELFGYWDKLNHPYIEVEDTAVAVIRFKNGGLGNIVVSNSQKPGLFGKVHVHGENGSSVGVQTDGGAMFISGMSTVLEPPINDIWTIPGEESLLPGWQDQDRAIFNTFDPTTYYHYLQDQDFLRSILDDRQPSVPGIEGRKVVELSTAIYRSQRDQQPIKFPLDGIQGSERFDGRMD